MSYDEDQQEWNREAKINEKSIKIIRDKARAARQDEKNATSLIFAAKAAAKKVLEAARKVELEERERKQVQQEQLELEKASRATDGQPTQAPPLMRSPPPRLLKGVSIPRTIANAPSSVKLNGASGGGSTAGGSVAAEPLVMISNPLHAARNKAALAAAASGNSVEAGLAGVRSNGAPLAQSRRSSMKGSRAASAVSVHGDSVSAVVGGSRKKSVVFVGLADYAPSGGARLHSTGFMSSGTGIGSSFSIGIDKGGGDDDERPPGCCWFFLVLFSFK